MDTRKISKQPGFALVVTLSLMILLTIIAVGLLTLSSISLRSSSQGQAQSEARANARLALMLAIGDLQKNTGLDTRITAPADITDATNPPLTGTWRSWEGSDHESTGRPIVPGYAQKTESASGTGRFLSWLVSGQPAAPAAGLPDPKNLIQNEPQSNTIPLLGKGSLGDTDTRQVHVVPVNVQAVAPGNPGAMAWWVSAENQKARLPKPYKPANNTTAAWSDMAKSHATADPKPFGLDTLLTDAAPAEKAISLRTVEFLPGQAPETIPHQLFHDLSINSVGLLTNSATGGWRKDMSLMTENWASLPADNLPFFRLTPDASSTTSMTKPTATSVADAIAPSSIIYPWATYPAAPGVAARELHGPVSTWPGLVDYATAYKRITSSGANNSFDAIPRPWASTAASVAAPVHDYLHKLRITPLIARIHWKFSHRTVRDNKGTTETDDDTFTPQILMTPVVTLWNPYNVRITCPRAINIRLAKPLPVAFRHYRIDPNTGARNALSYKKLIVGIPNDWPNAGYNVDVPYPAYSGTGHINHNFPNSTFNLAPGETRVFSPTNSQNMPSRGDTSNRTINMDVGYRPNNGLIFSNLDSALILKENDPVLVDAAFDATSYSLGLSPRTAPYDANREAVRLYIHVFAEGGENYDINMMMENSMAYRAATARAYWPPIPNTEFPQPTAGELENTWQPFLSTVFGARVASDSHMPGKGLVQTSPTLAVDQMTQWTNSTGRDHPVNAPYDYSFLTHTGAGGSNLPNIEPVTNRGYIVSGFDASEGLTRVALCELPLRPLASLVELSNWDFRGQNRLPPFQLSIIGNSDASPLIASNRINLSTAADSFQYDDPYCANHLLFDDWFFSSIAPEPTSFGKTIARTQQKIYQDFLDGTRNLANQAYQPIAQDRGLTPTDRDAVVNSMLPESGKPYDAWQKVASRLEVEGMFNVNSTSVKAWRALLGHARDQKIPYIAENGITLSGEHNHAFPRSTIAADVQAGNQGMSGTFPEASEFTGYRVFTDTLLDMLAEKIVEQVRARGPFLSLSEFVNRRLATSTDERALSGAIQTALNKMAAESGNASPNKALQDLSSQTQIDPAGDEDYKFRAAAAGYGSYGLPGWVRQADILRPLAPILSARDDTFTIRTYGDARDKTGKIISQAWCEASVRRTRNFVDPADPADSIESPNASPNLAFGRRYEILSFRWLTADEV